MKKLLFFLLIAGFCNAQINTAQFKNLDDAGIEKAVLQINPDTPKDVLKYRNTKTLSYSNGLSILIKENSIISVSGPFEVVFPIWKKYADEKADATVIQRTGTGSTVDRFVRLYKTDQPDYWIMEF